MISEESRQLWALVVACVRGEAVARAALHDYCLDNGQDADAVMDAMAEIEATLFGMGGGAALDWCRKMEAWLSGFRETRPRWDTVHD